MKANLTRFSTNKPQGGENTVVVGHDDGCDVATEIYPKAVRNRPSRPAEWVANR